MSVSKAFIRPAEESDATAIAAIYAPFVRETPISFEIEPPTAKAMAERIGSTLPTHPWLVAEREGDTVGFAYASKHRERPAYRWSADVTIYVSQAVHRRGVGRALYFPLLEVLRGQGFRSAFAEIVLPNAGSIRLHEAAGFEPIGVYKEIGFKLGRWQDISYWRLGLATDTAPPDEPIPFATFRNTPVFTEALALAR